MILRTMPLCLLLVACGGGADGGNNGSAEEATMPEAVPDNATQDAGNQLVPLPPAPAPSPILAASFPAAFQGRWALVANDCDPARDDAKGLMTVAADRLTFYESRATPDRIERAAPDRLVAQMTFTGEGQRWTKRVALTLLDGGRTLVREESEPVASLRYGRCPG